LFFLPFAFSQTETIRITTYYPAPMGIYLQLATQTLGVGDTNGNGTIEPGDSPDPSIAAQQGDLWIAGNVGIGTTNPQNTLDVAGNAVIGAGYAGVNTAPANGLLVEGDVGIGTTAPQANLEVNNTVRLTPTDAPLHTVRGAIYYNDSENVFKYNDDGTITGWRNIGGGTLGATQDLKGPYRRDPPLAQRLECPLGWVVTEIKFYTDNRCKRCTQTPCSSAVGPEVTHFGIVCRQLQ